MPSLSTPIGELQSEYGVVVVGSGYGGAIAACRMAGYAKARGKKGAPAFSVALFERGVERQAGDFPTSLRESIPEIQTDTKIGRVGARTGLFDFRINRDISVLVGCGLGGTSLINAGVMLEPTPAVLDDRRWPETLRLRHAIQARFKTVRDALSVTDYPTDTPLDKATWLSAAAARLEMKPFKMAPVAISFETKRNAFDVQLQRCVLCGNCISGCNHSAKNTVAMNYLPGAAASGAAIFSGIETRAIEKGDNGWWLVHVRLTTGDLERFGNPELVIRARMVFLAAGALGSTEILLRSRDRYGLAVSPRLGRGFSGNGDVIAFGYNAPDRINGFGYGPHVPDRAVVGPTIASMIDERRHSHEAVLIQEGAVPGALRVPLRFGAPLMARVTHILADGSFDFRFKYLWRELDSMIRGTRHGALARTQTFLAMGTHDGEGRMGLLADRLRIAWDGVGDHGFYRAVAKKLHAITKVMQGRYVMNPFWTRLFGRRLMTVHPLGGCRIGENARDAVVNADGCVFNGDDHLGEATHAGLYVCDGSVVPLPLGANPALTISALAEHIVDGAKTNRLLRSAPRSAVPGRVNRAVPGFSYAERTRGQMVLDGQHTPVELVLHLSAESIEQLIHDAAHELRVIGAAHTPGLPGRQRWTVSDGTINVLIDDPRNVDTKLLMYRLMLTSADGRQVWLRGHKRVSLSTLARHPWRALTQVPFVLYTARPDDHKGEVPRGISASVEELERAGSIDRFLSRQRAGSRIVGAGAVRSSPADALRLALSMRVVREPRLMRRLRWRWRFNWGFFIRTILETRVWILRRTRVINPFAPTESSEQLRHECKYLDDPIKGPSEENPNFLLTRYTGIASRTSTGRPVLLSPGFGMSTLSFHSAGRRSFAEYLHRHGYDVWLFDYRASDRLNVSLEQFDIDVLARQDFPQAIEKLYNIYNPDKTKTKDTPDTKIRIVAHCLSSMTMQMGLLAGSIKATHVHSMLLSQSHAFIDLPWPTRLKVRLRLPDVLRYLNFKPIVTSDFDIRSSFRTRLLDRLLYLFPSDERCHEGVCRRLLLLYGEVVRHSQLDKRTHELFYHMFDRGNLGAFKHIGRMFVAGRVVDTHGENTYLRPDNGRNVTIPITLLQGTANRMFFPSGALKTRAWLVEHGGFGSPADNERHFSIEWTDGYGHLDNFIGKNAPADVFPKIVKALKRMEELTPSAAVV